MKICEEKIYMNIYATEEAFETNFYCASVKVFKFYATRRTTARASSGLQVGIDDKLGPIHSHVWHRLNTLIW